MTDVLGEKVIRSDASDGVIPAIPYTHCLTTADNDFYDILAAALKRNRAATFNILEALANPDVTTFRFEAKKATIIVTSGSD